jgi:hypothetical protein
MGPDYWEIYQVAHVAYLKKLSSAENSKYPLVYLETVDPTHDSYWTTPAVVKTDLFESLRDDEIEYIFFLAKDGTEFKAYYSVFSSLSIQSVTNILRTVFLCVVLAFSSV